MAAGKVAGKQPAGKSDGGGNNLMAKKLKQMKERWDKAKEESKKGGSFSVNVDDGKYATTLTDATLKEAKNDTMGVVFEFTIDEGDGTGEKLSRWAGCDTDDRMVYLQKDLRKLGVDVDDFDIDKLPEILEILLKNAPRVRVTVKTNGDYVNVYIDKTLEEAAEPGEEPAEGGAANDAGEAGGEEPGEEGGEEPTDALEVGDEVRYKLKGKRHTGIVRKVNDDETVNIKNTATKAMDNEVSIDVCEKVAEVG